MKRIIMGAVVLTAIVMGFSSCKDHQTPTTDTTKLWPAYNMSTKKYGYIDQKGTFKIPAIYAYASTFFSCGYAVVSIDGKTECYIDKKGNIKYSNPTANLNPFFYNYATIYDNTNSKYGLLDKSFNLSIIAMYDYLGSMSYDGLVLALTSGSDVYGYVDAKGKSKISPMYKKAGNFVDGHAIVSVDGKKYGLIDKNAKWVIQPTYDKMKACGHSRWATRMEDADGYSFIDSKGNIKGYFLAIQGSYDDANLFAAENNQEKWGVVDQNGKELVAFQYDHMYGFCEGYATANTADESGSVLYIIDKKGKVIYSASYAIAQTPMHNGLILIDKYDMKEGTITSQWIDKKGNVVYSWTAEEDLAPARKAMKAEGEEWTSEPYTVLGK